MRSLFGGASVTHSGAFLTVRAQLWIAQLVGVLLLAGCASNGSQSTGIFDGLLDPPAPASASALAPEAEKFGCGNAAQCKVVLKTMIDSPDRGWIGKTQSPDAYANGTRLFAYRALRRQLTCRELALAVDEVHAATKSMGAPVAGMTADQLSRTRALSTQVEGELAKERAGRCRG